MYIYIYIYIYIHIYIYISHRSKRLTHPQHDLGREYNSLILGPLGHSLAIREVSGVEPLKRPMVQICSNLNLSNCVAKDFGT